LAGAVGRLGPEVGERAVKSRYREGDLAIIIKEDKGCEAT